jgi:DNA-binding transcriptional MerR regulator
MKNEKDYIDVEFTHHEGSTKNEVDSQRIISGEPLFYTTTQCAEMVGVESSTIRYWGKRFENLLDVEVSNRNRQYKKSDIAKLKFIKKLAYEDGLTLQQIEDYTTSKGFDINDIEKGIVDANNPLAVQTFVSAVLSEMDKKLNAFSESLLEKVNNSHKEYHLTQQELNRKLKEDVLIDINEIVTEKLSNTLTHIETQQKDLKDSIAITMTETIDNSLDQKLDLKLNQLTENITNQFKTHIDERELEYQKTNQEVIDRLKANLDETKEKYIQEQKENKKGLLGIFFGSKK